jgi:CheY-like chemotaxis protein
MDLKRARVVLVEDEKIMSTYLLGLLRRMGILDLYCFDDGLSALREIGRLKPDLIITDVHMEPMGGIELVQNLRTLEDEKLSSIPVIFLSADARKGTVGAILPLGVAGYLVKPPNAKTLEAKIVQAFKGYNTVIFD